MKSLFENWRKFVNERENIACSCVDSSQTNLTIKDVQSFLHNNNYPLPKTFKTGEADGKCGSETREAIMKFQEDNNLDPDACVGTDTASAIEAAKSDKTPKPAAIVKVSKKQEPKTQGKKILTCGDSLMAGACRGSIVQSLVSLLSDYTFVQKQKGGSMNSQIARQFTSSIDEASPDILIINGGVNDMLSNRKPASSSSVMRKVIKTAIDKGIRVIYIPIVLTTISHNGPTKYMKIKLDGKIIRERSKKYNEIMKSFCKSVGASYVSGVENLLDEHNCDKIHLKPSGSEVIANMIGSMINQ